jgi:hypothetical protein
MVPWRDYCLGIEVMPNGARLIRIMVSVSQPTGWNLLNYLMDDIRNLEKRPRGMYRVHFLGSAVEEVTMEERASQT